MLSVSSFTILNCNKWQVGCCNCPYPKKNYPRTLVDRTKHMWLFKKDLFTDINSLLLVTPSKWLSTLVGSSFLKEYKIKVINNGIDLNVFKPTSTRSNLLNGIPLNKFIILGVAFDWGIRKGLDVFIELSKRLSENYQIVLVGTNNEIDLMLPNNILSIHRTNNQIELSELYSSSDLFVNPTREDNYPTVIMESIACGTPVLTFDTGGCLEMIDETCGCSVACDDVDALEKEITRIFSTRPYSKDDCLRKAKDFDKNKCFTDYIDLYYKTLMR